MTQVLDVLEAVGISDMIVRSPASTQHGISRSTKDTDIVVELESQPISVITSRLGPGFTLNSQLMFEAVTGAFSGACRSWRYPG